jgi:adenine-specific DNA-methyltransferase
MTNPTKLTLHTQSKVDENIKRIGTLFPNAITERKNAAGETELAVDFDVLRHELSSVAVDGNEERYAFTWPDKRKSVLLANAPIAETLRPCRAESVNFDTTENLYIEGDNLDVLKLLQETYLGKVKMIYIDPPYNTGNDFVYADDFAQSTEEYLDNSGQYDDDGNRLVKNLDSNGRFHTDWLNMIYPRLRLARDLLTDYGVIFISIDEGEVAQLRKICDEIFGESNFVVQIIWEKRFTRSNNARMFTTLTEPILCYRKSPLLSDLKEPRNEKADSTYSNPDNDPRGVWTSVSCVNPATREQRPNLSYDMTNPITGETVHHPTNAWKFEISRYQEYLKEGKLYWGKNGENQYPRLKKFLTEMDGGMVPVDLWKYEDSGTTDAASKELEMLVGKSVFPFPKPPSLVKRMLNIATTNKDDIILDFFSGSATTAHAVMQLNAEVGGKRKFIMVQLPEVTDKKSEAYKAGYKNICEIGKERIRRAGVKIKDEAGLTAQGLDTGFRVLKLDSTNMKDVYYNPQEYEASLFESLTDNIKEDRTPEDLLFQVMLDLGVLLSSKITESVIADKKVFNVAESFLIACFDDNVTEETVKEIAQQKPYYAVFRDSSYASDSVATNFEQIFRAYSPDTVRRVL